MVLAWYLEQVLPSQYGIARPFHFPVSSLIRYMRHKFSSTGTSADKAIDEGSASGEDADTERYDHGSRSSYGG